MSVRYINLTPHKVVLNDGRVFEASGRVARVSSSYTEFDENSVAEVVFGAVDNLPAPETDTIYIVSGLVAAACRDRSDVVSPATGHPSAIRNEAGQIVSVPGFVRSR